MAKLVKESIEGDFTHMKPKSDEELDQARKDNPMYEWPQLCVWPGTLVGDKIKKFESFMLEHFGTRVKYAEEVKTLPGDGGEGGRNDLFFYVYKDDVGKFAIPRLQVGIRWWEDVLNNMRDQIYPQEIIDKYKPTW